MTIPPPIQDIMRALEGAGHSAHCVGGCVRDTLLGRTPGDWDVTTSARPEAVMALFGDRAVPTGLLHGTVTVRTEAGGVEITTHRREGAYLDHRRPSTVDFSASLEEDLARRDFTVNAMAVDLRGILTDPFGGRRDLAAGVLRCVGEPERRFREDGLRIIRALRFAAQLDFVPAPETAAALRRCGHLLRLQAAERLEGELTRLLCGRRPLPVLLDYPLVLGEAVPELLPAVGFDQRNRHHCYDVWEHTARSVALAPPDPALRWTMLLHDLGKPETFSLDERGEGHFRGHGERSFRIAGAVLERLRAGRRLREAVLPLVRWHDAPLSATERGIRRALRRFGEEGLRRLIAVQRADNLAQAPAWRSRQAHLDQVETMLDLALREGQCFSLGQLAVDGRDLLALGLTGRQVGETLRRLLDEVVEGRLPNDKGLLLAAAEEMRE